MEVTPSDILREALKRELSAHRLIVSPIGIFKILTVILFLISAILSLATGVCSQYSAILELTAPIVTVTIGVLVAILYILCIVGLAQKFPNVFIKVDITCCLIFAIPTLVLAIITIANCNNGGVSIIPGILGIGGSLFLVMAAAALFVAWQRAKNLAYDTPQDEGTRTQAPIDPRKKSVMI